MMLAKLSAEQWTIEKAAHLLNRAGFGGPPSEIDGLHRMGIARAVDSLVQFTDIEEVIPNPDWIHSVAAERLEDYEKARGATAEERQKLFARRMAEYRDRTIELQSWWIRRMVTTPRPFQEKLTLFWHGHFATSAQKVRHPQLMWRQNDLFRTHGTGKWYDLLDRVTRDPAMLLWLDQSKSRKDHPNENYARELLELFTFGEGNYSEQDVLEAARALTGLSLDRLRLEPEFRQRQHDPGIKTFLGKSGRLGPQDILREISEHPGSARFITAKLWRFFAGTDPDESLRTALAQTFSEGGRRIGPFLAEVFQSAEFYRPAVVRQQIKSPVQFVVMALRQLECELPAPRELVQFQRLLGQELFLPPNVKGWDDGISWINTTTLQHRHALATRFLTGENRLPAATRRPKLEELARRLDARRRRLARDDNDDRLPQIPRFFEGADRKDADALLAKTERRLIQGKFRDRDRKALLEFLRGNLPASETTLTELLRRAMCMADYQLT